MRPVWDDAVAAWVAEHIPGCERGFDAARAMGVLDGKGRICAGVVFHDWNPERGLIEVSAAATDRRWLTRDVVRAVFGYAFAVARMVVTRTSERNSSVRRIWQALGASEHVITGLWGPDEAGVIYTLTPEQFAASRLGGHDG